MLTRDVTTTVDRREFGEGTPSGDLSEMRAQAAGLDAAAAAVTDRALSRARSFKESTNQSLVEQSRQTTGQ